MTASHAHDLITIGRIGIDLYPEQSRTPLRDVTSFRKMLGGSPTNVAVAAARLGLRTAVVTKVGADGFGEASARALLDLGVRLAVVKMGPAGVLAATVDETVRVPPCEVEVVNGLGAGDAFGGALVHGLLSGVGLRRTVERANAAGALVAGRLGCADDMPDLEEIDAMCRGGAG
jgi:sugar/nucleoside kinase (ribokinase family)